MEGRICSGSLDGLVGRERYFSRSDCLRNVLWSLVVTQVAQLDSLLQNAAALQKLNARFNRAIDDALDTSCAQMRWQDKNATPPPVLMTFQEVRDGFFPYFESWIDLLLGQKGTSLPVSKHRIVAALIGAAYKTKVDPKTLTEQQWTNIVEFVRRPHDLPPFSVPIIM